MSDDQRACRRGFTPRPSLSVDGRRAGEKIAEGVAGVHAPAFVERQQANCCVCKLHF